MSMVWMNAILYMMIMTTPFSQPMHPAPSYVESKMIAHAAGEIEGKSYTNSEEALELSLSRDCRAIEIDFMFTSDQILVCNHAWSGNKGKPMTWDEYQAEGTRGGFRAMSAETLIRKIGKTDVDLIVDTQEPNTIRVYAELIRICRRTGCASYISHIIPQIYARHELAGIAKISEAQHLIYTVYKSPPVVPEQYCKLGLFCRRHGINTVTVPTEYALPENLSLLRVLGLHTAAHTVNDAETADILKKAGVEIIYTDNLY